MPIVGCKTTFLLSRLFTMENLKKGFFNSTFTFQTLLRILDSANHGVIYVSWGSMVRADSLPLGKREALLNAFASVKQTIVWKWESDTLPNKPANVFIRKWMPQREILCHPNVRVFLTHGGLLGSTEAAFCGVPVVCKKFTEHCESVLYHNFCMLIDCYSDIWRSGRSMQ